MSVPTPELEQLRAQPLVNKVVTFHWKFHKHAAAMKALASDLRALATGFWNVGTGTKLNGLNTRSQVSLFHFGFARCLNISTLIGLQSFTSHELASTHGFSSEINMNLEVSYIKHGRTAHWTTIRVLYLAVSPDGETIVTAAFPRKERSERVDSIDQVKDAITLGAPGLVRNFSATCVGIENTDDDSELADASYCLIYDSRGRLALGAIQRHGLHCI